jgi:hypothetical protein
MNLPDDTALKDEIKEISDKIDTIIDTVNEIYPMNQETASERDIKPDAQDEN